jgi:hypothetical protein
MFESGFSESMDVESSARIYSVGDSTRMSIANHDVDSNGSDNELDAMDIPQRCTEASMQGSLKMIPITTAAFNTYMAVM